MNEHLQRDLIDLYYALADFRLSTATDLNSEQIADTLAHFIVVKAAFEKIVLSLLDKQIENRCAE